MKLQRLTLLGLMLALLLLVGACGSDDDEGTGAATTEDGTSEAVSGSISVIGVWTGPEQASFQAVIDGFTEQNPDATVKYTSGGDNIVTVLSTAVEGGNPPDIATVSQPGTMADFVERGALKPLDFAVDAVQENFGDSIVETGSVDGTLYGLLFKAANKSTVWYNVASFADAGVEAPDTWDDFLEDAEHAQRVRRPGLLDRRRGRLDAHRPVREHLPPDRGRRDVRQAREARDPVDGPVGQGRPRRDGEGRRRHRQHRGRQGRSAADRLPDLGRERLLREPEGRDGDRGRLRPRRRRRQEPARAGRGLQHLPVPVDRRLGSRRSSAAATWSSCSRTTRSRQAFVEYLTTPEASEIWAKRGGFSSPNKNVDSSVYPDPIQQTTAGAIGEAEIFRFDLSDLQPSAFGGTVGQGLFKLFQDFVDNPEDIDGITAEMEAAAAKAYG